MSFPTCDRCTTDHNPFVSCADLGSQVQGLILEGPSKEVAKLKSALAPLAASASKDRKAYMRAYMKARRAKA